MGLGMRVMSKCHLGVVQREKATAVQSPDLDREWNKVGGIRTWCPDASNIPVQFLFTCNILPKLIQETFPKTPTSQLHLYGHLFSTLYMSALN